MTAGIAATRPIAVANSASAMCGPTVLIDAALASLLSAISTKVRQFDVYRGIAESYPNVFFSVGTHPHQAHTELDVTVALEARRLARLHWRTRGAAA